MSSSEVNGNFVAREEIKPAPQAADLSVALKNASAKTEYKQPKTRTLIGAILSARVKRALYRFFAAFQHQKEHEKTVVRLVQINDADMDRMLQEVDWVGSPSLYSIDSIGRIRLYPRPPEMVNLYVE